MADKHIQELIDRVNRKHLSDTSQTSVKQRGKVATWLRNLPEAIFDFLIDHKMAVVIALLCMGVVMVAVYFLTKDFLTKRQNYPERNVLFRSTNVMYIAGASEEKDTQSADQLYETEFYEGGQESKVGTYLFMTSREWRDDIEYFNMDNSRKIRIASATRKPEIVQAGLRLGGSLDFREQLAEIILPEESKAPQSYHVYKFVQERGLREVEVTVVQQADGTNAMDNRMIERREWILGWLWDKEFRAGTSLEQYEQTPENAPLQDEFLGYITELDSRRTVDKSERERMIKDARRVSEQLDTTPIYITHEDGFFDLLPQESTVYLAYKPNMLERARDAFLGASQHVRLRVENYWDLFPGSYPFFRTFHIGKGENVVYPFDKFNNGGYVLKDNYGELAKIDIQDFILYYGQDVVYSYYFDLNGDGRLDDEQELIGTVLCRTTHDERINLETLVGEGKPKADVTFTVHYSFMAPDEDLEQGMEYFKLCGYIESMMPDQVNRGFGKHSMLGYINQQRSDIMLFKDLTIENMSRALTQESTLVARYDIVKALIAAKRPYAESVAQTFGLADQFAGQYQTSAALKRRRSWDMIVGTILALAAVTWYYVGKKRKQSMQKQS